MIPRFSNPHLRVQTTRIVSRHDLHVDDVVEEGLEIPSDDALVTLETLVKRSLGEFQLQNDTSGEASMSQERAKKRRKVRGSPIAEAVGEMQHPQALEETVPFRLVSCSRTTTVISLKPKPQRVFKAIEPAYEDTEATAKIRAERAAAVAVDAAWVSKEAQKSYHTFTRKCPIDLVADDLSVGPPMFIAQMSKPLSPDGPTPVRPRLPEKTRSSPHELKMDKLKYSVVKCDLPTGVKRRKPRRRGKSREQERPPPAFWRPMREWGGKSAGYAYGFPSSRPMWSEHIRWQSYRRDNMRTATFVV